MAQQENSLNMAIQELAAISRAQLNILNDMNSKQSANMNTSKNIMSTQPMPSYGPPTNPNYAGQQPNYLPPMFPQSEDAMYRQQQFGNYLRDIAPSNYGFVNSVLPNNVRRFGANNDLLNMDYASRVSQAAVAGLGVGATSLGTIAASSILPGIGGLLAGGVIGAGVGLAADISVDEIKKQSAYEKYLMQNSYRFINSNETNNKRGLSGFNIQESRQAGKFLRGMSDEFFLKDQDMMMLTQQFTEGGLLKDTKDLESFKKRMQTLTKSVKTSALILNETYDEVAKMMSDLKKLGFDQKDFSSLFSDIKINASNMGVDAGDLARKIAEALKQLNAGTPHDSTYTNSRINDTTIYMSSLYNELEAKASKTAKEKEIYNTIKNYGGVDDASIKATALMEQMLGNKIVVNSAAALYDYDSEAKEWRFNAGQFKKFTNGELSFNDLLDQTGKKFQALNQNGQGAAMIDWRNNAGTYIRNSMGDGDLTKLLTSTVVSMSQHPDLASQNFDIPTLLSSFFQVTDPGQKNLLSSLFQYRQQKGDMFSNSQRLQNMWLKKTGDVLSSTPTIKEWISSKWGKAKDWMSEGIVDFSGDVSDFMIGLTEKFYGVNKKIPTRYDKTFSIKELTDGFDVAGIRKKQDEAYRLLAQANEGLETVYNNPGIKANTGLLEMSRGAMNYVKGDMSYTREIVSNWEQVSQDMRELKDVFVGSAKNNGLSETILMALAKHDQSTSGKQITKGDIEHLANNLGNYLKQYGGNEQLALARQLGIDVDSILMNNEVNPYTLRQQGKERFMLDINFSELEMDEKIRQKFEEVFNKNIKNPGYNAPQETVTTEEFSGNFTSDSLNYDHYSGAGHMKGLIKKAAEQYGIGEEYIAALTKTENDSGNNNYVNGIQATGVMQLTPVAVEKYKNKGIKSLSSGNVWDNSMDQLRTDIGMNVAVGANEYKDMIDIAKGNGYLAYGFYSHGPTGFKKVLNRAGITEDQYAGLTPDQILGIARDYGKGDTFATMERYYKQLKLFTNDFTTWTGKEGETKTVETPVAVDGSIETSTSNNRNGIDVALSYVDEEGKPVDPNDPNLHIKQGMKTSAASKDYVSGNVRFVQNANRLMGIDVAGVDAGMRDTFQKELGPQGFFDMVKGAGKNLTGMAMSNSIFRRKDYSDYRNNPAGSAANKYSNYIKSQMDKTGMTLDEILSSDSKANRLREKLKRKLKKEDIEGISEEDIDDLLVGRSIVDKFSPKQMILENLGVSNGITKRSIEYRGDLNKYNADLISNAELTYKGNMQQMLEYIKGNLTGEMSESGAAWQSRSATEKASVIEMTKVLGKVLEGGQLGGYAGLEEEVNKLLIGSGKTGVEDVTSVLLGEKDKEQAKHLHKEKDSKGEYTGKIYYDASKESEDSISSGDITEWVSQGEKSRNVVMAETEFKKANNVDLGQLSYKEGILESKRLYEKMLSQSFEANDELAKYQQSNFADKAIGEGVEKSIKDGNMAGLKELLDSINGRIKAGETGLEGDYKKVEEVLKLMEQVNSELNPDSILKMIEGIQKFQNIAKDIGNITTLTMEIGDEALNTDFTMRVMDEVKKIFDKDDTRDVYDALLKDQVDIKNLLDALVNGGTLDINGKTIELSADTMNSLAVLFGKEMEDTIKDSLKSDTKVGDEQGFLDSILNNKPIKDVMGKIFGGEEVLSQQLQVLAKSNKDIEDLKAGNEEAAKALKEGNETLEQTIDRVESERDLIVNGLYAGYQSALSELSDNLKSSTDNANKFGTTMEKYDASIAKAISVMEDRIKKLENKPNVLANIIEGGSAAMRNIFNTIFRTN